METIRYKLHEGGSSPEIHGDWIDLATAEECVLKKGASTVISLGISIEVPKGFEAHLAPRSSTFKKYGVLQTNGVGVIDNAYNGDGDVWGMPVYAVRDTVVPAGTRICQFRIIRVQPKVVLAQVSELGNADRGGFGSTGEKVAANEQ